MSGDHAGAIQELEEAEKAGLDIWIISFYQGRALCSIGRYAEALPFLHRALHQRGQHPDIATWLHIAHVCQCQLFRAAYHQVASAAVLLTTEPRNALRLLPRTLLFALAVLWNKAQRATFFTLAAFVSDRRLLYKLFHPDDVQATLGTDLSSAGHFKAAEDLCRRGLISLPDSIMLLSNLATALAFQGRKEDAIAELEKALLIAPDNRVLLWNRKQITSQEQLRVRPIHPNDEVPEV